MVEKVCMNVYVNVNVFKKLRQGQTLVSKKHGFILEMYVDSD